MATWTPKSNINTKRVRQPKPVRKWYASSLFGEDKYTTFSSVLSTSRSFQWLVLLHHILLLALLLGPSTRLYAGPNCDFVICSIVKHDLAECSPSAQHLPAGLMIPNREWQTNLSKAEMPRSHSKARLSLVSPLLVEILLPIRALSRQGRHMKPQT